MQVVTGSRHQVANSPTIIAVSDPNIGEVASETVRYYSSWSSRQAFRVGQTPKMVRLLQHEEAMVAEA